MSIGPSENARVEEVLKSSKFVFSTKKAVSEYFAKPAHFLFYSMLTFGAGALLINQDPSLKFWLLLIAVGILNNLTSSLPVESTPKKVASPKPNKKS